MKSVAEKNGAVFHLNSPVEKIEVENNKATNVIVNGEKIYCDALIASADYHHVESKLLSKEFRNYDENYWEKKTMAPSSLIYYLGVRKKIKSLQHHTLFFDEGLDQHSKEIYVKPEWPSKPLFYVCCPSKTDENLAPNGHENIFFLMPIAPGLNDTEEIREEYFQMMLKKLENQVKENISEFIDFKKSYCINDFILDYNSFKGNAYGLANTLMQTAILKPKIRNKKVKNLFYAGQLTVPGPGVPPSIISGKVVSDLLMKNLNNKKA